MVLRDIRFVIGNRLNFALFSAEASFACAYAAAEEGGAHAAGGRSDGAAVYAEGARTALAAVA